MNIPPKLRHFLQLLHRKTNNDFQCTPYIKEIRKLQKEGFYRVDLGETKIPEGLITGDISLLDDSLRSRPVWSIVHAGGARGWVPWNYKMFFHWDESNCKPSGDSFNELCSNLRDTYGKCAIVTNTQSLITADPNRSGVSSSACLSSPIELLSTSCCPKVAQTYGHELLQLPSHCGHLSPLTSVWWSVKWFIYNNREKYCEEVYDRSTLHKYIFYIELIEDSLKDVTRKKWREAASRVKKTEDYYVRKHL
ncbi:protein FAM243-like [Megalops cyprinoides]|uniref:protein FAM243-like n=1 Tax=Megalops cyprinoides TaxID=118141 RepID=UPI001863A8AB|nr:protein FAM243-like [Megalops cyprinoides]